MFKFLPFAHFYGLVIVPVFAMMLALPASAQNNSSSETQGTKSETESTSAILISIDKSKQKMTVSLDGVEKRLAGIDRSSRIFNSIRSLYCHLDERDLVQQGMGQRPHASFYFL